MTSAVLNDLLHLPKRERLEIAERLWLSVADEATMPVPASHKRVLKKRLADFKSGTSKPISHDELMRRVRSASVKLPAWVVGCYDGPSDGKISTKKDLAG